jgi:hypothetical protein
MPDYTVLDHRLDGDIYHVIVGRVETRVTAKVIDGQLVMSNGEPETEEVQVVTDLVEDFVFAADDERWQGKDPEQIAAEQRRLIKEQLDQRDQEREQAELRAAEAERLPGVGDAL